MKSIANKTDGRYFRATVVAEIYGEINKLETTEIENLKFDYDEIQAFCLACRFLCAEIGLKYSLQRSFMGSSLAPLRKEGIRPNEN
jgi:Ca-activated chloride channel family protein